MGTIQTDIFGHFFAQSESPGKGRKFFAQIDESVKQIATMLLENFWPSFDGEGKNFCGGKYTASKFCTQGEM